MAKKKSALTKNLALKVLALSVAVLLELYFYSPDNSITVNVPATIEIRRVPPGMVVVQPLHAELGISCWIWVRGPRPLIEQVKSSNNKFVIDYPNDGRMEFVVRPNQQQLWLPSGVEVVEVNPNSVNVKLERVLSKEVDVVVDKSGEVAKGFQLAGLSVSPAKVTVRGPESELKKINSVFTQKFDLSGLEQDKQQEVVLEVSGRLLNLSVNMVTVNAKIVKQAE